VGAEEGFYEAVGDSPGADDLGLAWDATERYAVTLLWEALPEVQSVPAPIEELNAAVARIRSAIRKWPYRHLARAAWNGTQPRPRQPADDTQFWLDAAGAMATMGHHLDVDSPLLEPVSLLRPADWAGAVIGLVRSGVNAPVTAEDLVRYTRECPEIASERATDDDGPDYDPFRSAADDDSLSRAFAATLVFWEAVGAVSPEWWLTRLGWWGLPRALARAWNGDFDRAAWVDSTDSDLTERTWPGTEPHPEDLGILRPPLGF